MYAIEKNIPLPKKFTTNTAYPFYDMKIGHSFFVKATPAKLTKVSKALNNAIQRYKKKNKGTNFTVRKVKDGYRVWRIA